MFSPNDYQLICSLFPRFLGLIYFVALVPFLFQIRALIGEKGILPVENFLALYRTKKFGWKKYIHFPTLFWWKHSDGMLVGTVALGVFCAFLLTLGYVPYLLIPFLIVIHLSIVIAGQDFLSFGWEGFLLEISYNTFLLTLTNQPNIFVWVSLNLLIFRFHLQAGASKLQTRDPNWRNLTAMCYHYQTQPLPNPLAWYMHKLPVWFHKFSTGFMFFVELLVPFAIFGTEEMRLVAFIFMFVLQFSIALSGNYSYLNFMSMILITLLLSNTYLAPIFGPHPFLPESPLILQLIASLGAISLISLQLMQLWNQFFRNPKIGKILSNIYSLHFANRYGIFAIMTTTRYEIVFEGSEDQKEWKEYLFYFKPSEVGRRPSIISPFQPRLDWQAWFLPFTKFKNEIWVQNFLARLLEGELQVLKLLRHNPFPEKPPKYLRAQVYIYEFSPWSMKKRLGNWWVRTHIGPYTPILSLPNKKEALTETSDPL
jgi:hypothetical protein